MTEASSQDVLEARQPRQGQLVPAPGGSDLERELDQLDEELVASAADRGLQLTSEGGLLTGLARRVLQVEMAHLATT